MMKFNYLFIITLLTFSTLSFSFAQGDLLNETEIQPLPEEMTFEEYRDANRRLISGVIVSSLIFGIIINE